MNTVLEFFSSPWTQALGWTLLHSLWQGLAIFSLVALLLRFIPSRKSSLRYSIAAVAMLLMLTTSIVTFTWLSSNSGTSHNGSGTVYWIYTASIAQSQTAHDSGMLNVFTQAVQSNMPFIITLWFAGSLLFSLRLLGSWWYIMKLKSNSIPLDNEWSECVSRLARQLNIRRLVTLARSAQVNAPVVIGYIRPVILIPVGMFSGLSTAQIEAIFIHELTHIRRHDYLINIIQSFIEAIFFFNPFVWIVSAILRREREHCCDDTVIAQQGNARAYAYALAHLEEVRIAKTTLALSLAGNKNELLNRIKRIMEKSVKNHSGRERIIPAVLLVVGLMCASWLTISNRTGNGDAYIRQNDNETLVAQDTTIKKKKKSATYSRSRVTTIGPDGEPREEVKEEFEGDEELRPLMAVPDADMDMDIHIAIPPMPDVEAMLSPLADVDIALAPMAPLADMDLALAPMGPLADMNIMIDTIPGAFHWRSRGDWEAFEKEFEQKFKESFGDFYKEHQKELEKMFQDIETSFKDNHDEVWASRMEDVARRQADIAERQADIALRNAEKHEKNARRLSEDHMRRMEDEMRRLDRNMVELDRNMKAMEENMKKFEAELKEQLVRDGYLEKNEKITNMSWSEDGPIEINGKEIKKSDEKKYKELHKKYFKDSHGNFRYEE
jgi:beta-lactamase regulating signal transducer with metallopeptidase domain